MNKKQALEALELFKGPRFAELPNFDIYMDQVVNYINDHLSPLNIGEGDKPITAHMVNNYVKNALVAPPIKKHYTRDHLAFLLVVTILKKIYSLSEIKAMIDLYPKVCDGDLPALYDTFMEGLEKALNDCLSDQVSKRIPKMDPKQRLLHNIVQSVALKIAVELDLLPKDE